MAIYTSIVLLLVVLFLLGLLSWLNPLKRRRRNKGSVIRPAILFGFILGSVVFVIYALLNRHEWALGNWLWCFAAMMSLKLVWEVIIKTKKLSW